jgi:energy-coupling factor transporter ATP-binding protein EcfA2
MSGRENVILNASILGIAREDVRKRMDHIIEFSGLRDFIDMPVKHYSSGMYVRLGFAVAVETDPDILLTDEVLAVGDVAFQNKCMERLHDFKRRGKTMMFVSHALETVQQFCDEAMLILQGQLSERGAPKDVIFSYLKDYMLKIGELHVEEFGTRQIVIEDITLRNQAGEETTSFESGAAMRIELQYYARDPVANPVFGFGIKSANGVQVCGSNTQIEGYQIPEACGRGKIQVLIEPLTLRDGHFFLSLSCHSPDHRVQYHRLEDWLAFTVKDSSERAGLVRMENSWNWQP